MTTVILEVSGGVVQAVFSDGEVRVIKIDWDAGESPGDAANAGEMYVDPLSAMSPATCEALNLTE